MMSEKQQLAHQDLLQQPQPFNTSQTASQSQPIVQQGSFWPSTTQSWPSIQQPVVVQVISRNQPVIYDRYNSERSKALGITQIVLGSAALLINVIGIIVNETHTDEEFLSTDNNHNTYIGTYYWRQTYAYHLGAGIWGTVCCFLSGAFAICAAKKKTKGWIITHMIFAILGSVFAFIILCFACWAVGQDGARLGKGFIVDAYRMRPNQGAAPFIDVYAPESAAKAKGVILISVLYLVVSIGVFVACIWSSTLCCKVLCSATNRDHAAHTIQYNIASRPEDSQIMIMDTNAQTSQGTQAIQAADPRYIGQAGVIQAPGYTPLEGQDQASSEKTYSKQKNDVPQEQQPSIPPPAYQ